MQKDRFFFSFMKANSSAPIFMWSICLITCKHSTQDHLSSQIQLIFLLFSPSLFLFLFFHRLKQWGIFKPFPVTLKVDSEHHCSSVGSLVLHILHSSWQRVSQIWHLSFPSCYVCFYPWKDTVNCLLPPTRQSSLCRFVSLCVNTLSLLGWTFSSDNSNSEIPSMKLQSFSPVNDVWLPLKPNKW